MSEEYKISRILSERFSEIQKLFLSDFACINRQLKLYYDTHAVQRMAERSYYRVIAVNNVCVLIQNLFEKRLCEILYITALEHKPTTIQLERTVNNRKFVLCCSVSLTDIDFKITVRTYIPDCTYNLNTKYIFEL